MTAYQITSMMEGVVQRGTATVRARCRQADRRQDRHHQRREGRLVHRLFARHRLRRLYGLRQAAAISPAARPAAISPRRSCAISSRSRLPTSRRSRSACRPASSSSASTPRPACAPAPGDTKVILEAFKPGTAPPDSYSVIGADNPASRCRRSAAGLRPTPTAPCAAAAPADCTEVRDPNRQSAVRLDRCDIVMTQHLSDRLITDIRHLTCAPKSKPSSPRSSSRSGC